MKLPLRNTTSSTLYTDLSYKEFFDSYNPYIDGQAYIATFSFNHKNFDFWAKLEPLSVIFVHDKHKKDALDFLRRFPLYEVYSVPYLHTKAIFFCNSCRLLLGSENLYMPKSTYSELMIEMVISEEQRNDIINFAFRSLKGEILTCKYELSDIKINPDGFPYLPCEKEITYWDLLVNRITIAGKPPDPEYHSPSYIYHLLEYEVNNNIYILSFNRGYVYSGDISVEAFNWLIQNCEITQYCNDENIGISTASDLIESSPRKDDIFKFHPIAKNHKAIRSYWLGVVMDIHKYQDMVATIKPIDITAKKIRRPK